MIDRAEEHVIGGTPLLVPRAADLILLKLSAAGPKDMWDIPALMDHVDRKTVLAEVDGRMDTLPESLRKRWARLRQELISTATSG